MKIGEESFDTGVIINCALDEPSLNGMKIRAEQNGISFVISSEAEKESIRKLVRTWKMNPKEATKKVADVVAKLGIRIEGIQPVDYKEGWKLTQKYGKDEKGRDKCHPPDNFIIAHLKRLGIELTHTCDEKFAEVCIGEKMGNFLHTPIRQYFP